MRSAHARLERNTDILNRLLSDDYIETDAAGARRTTAEAVARWTSSPNALRLEHAQLRSNDGVVIVTGEQADGATRILFTRVYVRPPAGGWQIISNAEVARAADVR